jgi:RNA polymerase sigma-70 factor, ECF subfamily
MMRACDTRVDSEDDIEALVARAKAGETRALEVLYERHIRMVHAVAGRLLGGAEDLDDVIQDSFVHAIENLRKLEVDAAFSTWLRTIVVRTASRRMRRRRLLTRLGLRREEAIDLEQITSPGIDTDRAVELRRVYAKLAQLPVDERVAYILRKIQGLEILEVAEATGTSPTTVKRRVRRAAEHLGVHASDE